MNAFKRTPRILLSKMSRCNIHFRCKLHVLQHVQTQDVKIVYWIFGHVSNFASWPKLWSHRPRTFPNNNKFKIARQKRDATTFGPSQKAKCPLIKKMEAAECLKSNKLCVRAWRQMEAGINSREKAKRPESDNALVCWKCFFRLFNGDFPP